MRVVFFIILAAMGITNLTNAQRLVINTSIGGDTLRFEVQNNIPCPLTLTAQSSLLDTSFSAFIPRGEKAQLFQWPNAPKILTDSIKSVFTYNTVLGDPNTIHDDEYEYNLPFPKGKAYMLSQGNKTEFTHNTPLTQYAFDFAMPTGSFVAAARGGIVGYVQEDYTMGGNDRNLIDKGNTIMICHNDDTVGIYAHLQHKGAFVEVGDRVFSGQVIGRSGNTGYSTSPHLHFAVHIANRSIPIRFRDEYTILYEGEIYEHQ